MAAAIRQEVAREVDQLLRVIFNDRRRTGRLDLEAIEMAVRSAMHQAGAAALTELPGRRSTDPSLFLRPPGSLPGVAR